MEESETKFTTVEKVKDPRRVEQGKRIGAISRVAKAKKAMERARVKEHIDNTNMLYIAVATTAVLGLTYGAYTYLYTTRSVKDEQSQPKIEDTKVSRLEKL